MKSAFIDHQRVIASALALMEQTYTGAMGGLGPAAESRVALDPLGVLVDMGRILEGAAARIGQLREERR